MSQAPLPAARKAALINLGCAKNLVDSEVMLGHLGKAGYRFVARPEEADVVVVNTCGFIQPARDEALGVIRRLARLKRRFPGMRLAVTGCYVRKEGDSLRGKFPEVDVWLGVGAFDRIVEAVEGLPVREPAGTYLYGHRTPRLFSTPPAWAYLKIAEGCSHRCAFCAIPSIKGPYRSRGSGSIVAEARAMAARGVREINLISQDTTFFGKDRGVRDGVARLIEKLIPIRGIEWIRLLYGYPEEITARLLDVLGEDKVCPYLDIPVQHSEPAIIRRMGRGMDGTRVLKLIERIRKRIPDIALRTSLIVGFPGEGRKELRGLERFVREARFHHLGVFTYSPEPGTPSSEFGDPVPAAEKERRRDEIMRIQAGISLAHNRSLVGRRLDVIVDGHPRKSGAFIGRTKLQAPEVDGVVDVRPAARDLAKPAGIIRRVEITAAGVYDLRGERRA
jgi:ribosomal protein S12 methylthiotransferase